MKTHKNVKCIKIYSKGVLKNNFVFVEISDTNLLYQLRSKSLIHQRDFDLKYIWDILVFDIASSLYNDNQYLSCNGQMVECSFTN